MRLLLRLGLLLLGTLPGRLAAAQAPLPPGTVTPDTLSRFCAPQGPSCVVPLAGAYTLALSGDWRLPRSTHLRFAPGSTLHVSGGTLQFDGGSVEAPAGETIFPDAEQVRGLAASRPEWFAAAPAAKSPMPADALADAYQATEPWGTIYLQQRAYISPFSSCPPATLRFLSPRTLVGAGRPTPYSLTDPTRLLGGTVLLGGIFGTAPLRLAHLGIDVGPAVSADVLHGCQPAGVFIEQPSNHQFVSGDRLEDVSVLSTGAFNMHSVMIAGHTDTEVRGLWIWSLGGTHGLVMKSSHSVVDGLHCWGAVSDCLIVKSDYATDFLGRAVDDRVAHVEIAPLHPGGYVGGIVVESRWDAVRSLEMDDIRETGTDYSLTVLGSSFYRPRDITVTHWTSDAVSGICLVADRADNLKISGFHCGLRPFAWAGALLRRTRNAKLDKASFICDGDPAACAAGHTNGIVDETSSSTFRNVSIEGLGGYALLRRHPAEGAAGLQVLHMGDRLVTGYEEPVWFRTVWPNVKPDLRILYTAVYVRVLYRPWLYSLLGALVVLTAVWETVHRRRRLARAAARRQ